MYKRKARYSSVSCRDAATPLEAIIAHDLPHNCPILLLHKALIIAAMGPRMREGDVFAFAIRQQFNIEVTISKREKHTLRSQRAD